MASTDGCTAVDSGSIHLAPGRSRAARDQTSTAPTTSHRAKDRRKPLQSRVLESGFCSSITFQNNDLGDVCPIADRAHASLLKG